MKQSLIIIAYLFLTTVVAIQEKDFSCKVYGLAQIGIKTITCVQSKSAVVCNKTCLLAEKI